MIHKTTRSILSVLLAALLLVTSTPLTPAFAGEGGAVSLQSENGESEGLTGSGTESDPYQIGSAEDLREFADKVNNGEIRASAVLTDDINLNPDMKISEDGTVTNGKEPDRWTPIGTDINPYRGTFDGNGKTISGLYIDSNDYYQGLFGYLSTDGDNTGTVQNLSVSGSVSGSDHVGGVVGYNDGGRVENCYNTGAVSGGVEVGGVVGSNSFSATVTNCYNTGKVSGNRDVGGVVGDNSFGATVTNCYNTGEVSGPDSGSDNNVGGVVGDNRGTVKNCYNTGSVSGPDSGSGNSVGGVVGYNDVGGSVTGCYFLQGTAGSGIGTGGTTGATELTAEEFAIQSSFTNSSWDFASTWKIEPIFGRPTLQDNAEIGGTANNPYKIFTATQLENFRDLVNNGIEKSAHAKLMNNIVLNEKIEVDDNGAVTNQEKLSEWIPIGRDSFNPYSGTFNGDGHTISGLYIKSTADYQGLFGYVSGTVQNLSVSGSVSGNSYVGGVVGLNRGSVEDCDFTGSVTNSVGAVGGVVGYNGGTVKNCYNTGSVTNSVSPVGGVVGDNSGNVTNSYNTGEVSGVDDVGGVVGLNDGNVTGCYNTGKVSGTSYVGGVVGENPGGRVKNCYNTGEVSGSESVGGVVGYNSGPVTGCYFLQTETVNKNLPGIGLGGEGQEAIQKTADEFHSGEVAWRLQSKQTAAGEGEPALVWGQSALGTEDSLPTLVALNPDAAQPVYKVTFKYGYEGAPEEKISYTNGSVKFPAFKRTGHTLTGWQNEDGQTVQGESVTITADTTYIAEWTANTYTITVTAGSGGTVSGSGEYSEGTEVTVTATPATGYHFVNWTENGTEVSTEATFTFNATVDRNLIAIFAKNEDPTPTPTPDPEPSGPSTGDSTGWDDIRDELENTAKGDQITIDMGDETKVPAEIFESLAGKDVDVTFDLGDIQWSASGADIPTDTDFTDLDLGASLGTHGIPVNVINTITGEVGTVQITLAHDGEFGFTMTLTAPLGKENAGYWANLYHYKVNGGEADREDPLGDDEDAEALNFEAVAKIDEDGSVTIPFSHASQYAIVIDTHSHAAVSVSDIFVDVAPNAWYKDAVQYAYDHGLMTGVSDTEFAPEATTTRAMIVSILARLEGVESAQAAGFADVDDNDWYATAVNWAANVGVVNGYEDNTFRPNQPITREQLAAILMNYAAYKGQDVSARASLDNYTDQPSTWAEETMSWAVAEGLISGVTNDELRPQGNATRAQVAAILQRFLEA